MELNVIKEEKNKLNFELKGEDHTFCNILRKELWNDSSTKSAGYDMRAGLVDTPDFTVETSGKSPKKALLDAVNRLEKKFNDFLSKFKK